MCVLSPRSVLGFIPKCRDVYWAIRRSSCSVRPFLNQHHTGSRAASSNCADLWTYAELIDTELAEAHQRGGIAAVNWALASSDRLEHALSRIGAEVSLQISKDGTMSANMLSTRHPGESHVMPEWAVSAARQESKAEHKQQASFFIQP